MPLRSPEKVDKILEYTAAAANVLEDVATASEIPFLSRVCTITLAVIPMVQNTGFQRERCLRLVEEIHHSLCALTSLSIHSADIQAPKTLHQISQFAATLQKLDSCLRSQRELGTIKRLFKQGEITAQLDTCDADLRALLGIFTAKQEAGLANALVEFSIDTETRHQELLEMISSQSSSLDTVSSIGRRSLNSSSGSFSLLPACPKIFHGREFELEGLVDTLLEDTARVAILGPGGMGKTTLAMAALHHPEVANKYQTRYFISCESAHTRDSLIAIIGSHLGLDTSSTSERAVVGMLSAGQPCLVILDNFETPWEAAEGRDKVEEFLALLADIPQVALLLTMRGAERPRKVQWTHPFLGPLLPLDRAAARQTFIEIADEIHDDPEIDQLLNITDNIPLAVQLIASVAASEGCETTLERWNLERIALLSTGFDKRSNLEISITLSVSSPRLQSLPHAVDLLSLMSLLSDGITDLDLVQSNIPIPDIPNCKTTLIRTSLAYVDHAGRFKVLAPIRDYIYNARPPSLQLVRPLRKYLIDLLKLYEASWHASTFAMDLVPRLVSNLGNLHSVLLRGLESDHTDLRESLMLRLPEILSGMDDHELHGRFIAEVFGSIDAFGSSELYMLLRNPELAMDKGIEHFRLIQDSKGEARLYCAIAAYYLGAHNLEKAEGFYRLALSVASQCRSDTVAFLPLIGLAMTEWNRGNYSRALGLGQKAHRIACVLGNVRGELYGIRMQAHCYISLGDFKHTMEILEEAKELVVRAGMQGGQVESVLMSMQAEVYLLKTEYSDARRIQEAILRQTSAVFSPVDHAYALMNIASLDIATGASADVVSRNLNAAFTSFQNAHHLRGIFACEYSHAELRYREGDVIGAGVEYIRLFAAARDNEAELAYLCLARLADPTNLVHTEMECRRWAVVFLAFGLRPLVRGRLMVHQALQSLGGVLVQQGADDTALSVLTVALEGFTQMDVHQSRAKCMCTIGDVYVRRGDLSGAREMWEAARPLFEHSEQTKEIAGIDKKLQALSIVQKFQDIPTIQPTLQEPGGYITEQKPI